MFKQFVHLYADSGNALAVNYPISDTSLALELGSNWVTSTAVVASPP